MKTDRAYEYDINALIPIAEKEAKKKVTLLGVRSESRPGRGGVFYNHCFFTQFFHEEMLKLSVETELRSF